MEKGDLAQLVDNMNRRSRIGKFIHTSWVNMNIRAGLYRHLQTSDKCKSYKNINIEFSREDYKNFCILNCETILSLKRPSIDRIDKNLNYTLDNIQFIELEDNIRKDKIISKNGKCICYMCKEEKDEFLFTKDKRRLNGRSTLCKECDNFRKKIC